MTEIKKKKTTAELTKGFEELLKKKELKPNGKNLFDNVLKKATKPHDSK